jgi:hypothetical protein
MTKSLERLLVPVFSLLIASACTAGGDSQPEGGAADAGKVEHPKPEPTKPTPTVATKVSVASVQMIQDCPDNEPAPADEGPAQAPAAERSAPMPPSPGAALGDVEPGGSFQQPCDQSTVQLALDNGGDGLATVEIKAVRILSNGKVVGTLQTRKPKVWANNTYEAWDQTVAPNTPTKASYKLSLPDWSEVEKAIGTSSFGHMFTLELDVEIDGQVQTVSSPEFPREEPHVIVT